MASALAVAALTALVFVSRAGDAGAGNWPVDWDLRNSDNGVLFQVASDVFAGRTLDWSFSPQVYVFPEIPISLAAYALAGGNVQLYFLFVAALNNVVLFLALFAVARHLAPAAGPSARLARAALATTPLLLLPLLASTQLWSYHLAPTYYFGMYLLIVIAPLLFLAGSPRVRVAAAIGIALIGASNPLAFVFTGPALACVAWMRARRAGWRPLRRPAAELAGVLLLAAAVRLLVFSGLQGGSPLAYMDPSLVTGKLDAVRFMFRNLLHGQGSSAITVAGLLAAAYGLVWAVRARRRSDAATLTRAYYGLVPLTGLAATFVLLITNYLYFWPVLVAPFVLLLLTVPGRRVRPLLASGSAAFVVIALATGATSSVANASSRYFDYRSDETRCLDDGLPAGVDVGYSTFSDARRLSLPSARGFRLIQLTDTGGAALWLTNRAYIRENVGRFFYFNDQGAEKVISRDFVTTTFGPPDRRFSCGPGRDVWMYDDRAKLDAIARQYGARLS